MRWVLFAGCLLASASAGGQEPPRIKLDLTTEQAQLIVQTLGQIQCQSVAQMETCFKASDLLKDIRNQVKAQLK